MSFNKEDFCQQLLALRTSHDMSQQALADLLGLNRSTVTYYERGKTIPNLANLVKIASIFNVSTDYLLGA